MEMIILLVLANVALVSTPIIGIYTTISPIIPILVFITMYILLYIKLIIDEYKH